MLLRDCSPLGLGCWVFDQQLWDVRRETELMATMKTALDNGVSHFDTASGYGSGSSERLVGRFLANQRERVFLASKANVAESAGDMLENVRSSLTRLQTDWIDLYYIHWPDSYRDMRPTMEGLEMARRQGLIRAVGVSNFSVAQMDQVVQVGPIEAYQLGYNLLWRHREQDVIAACRERGIPVITYGSLAQGILTGKFPRQLHLASGDQRNSIIFFRELLWPRIFDAVEQLKTLAEEVNRPLHHLAIRWTLTRLGVQAALVGARTPEQAQENAAALQGDLPEWVFDRMTAISDDLMKVIPDSGNMYGYYP